MNLLQRDFAPGVRLIRLSGPLMASQAEKIIQRFREVSEQGVEGVVVDLNEVPFIDSRGLAALLAGYKLFGRQEQSFQLAAPQAQPKLLFELTGFDRIFQIFDRATVVTEAEPTSQTSSDWPVPVFEPALAEEARG